MNTRVVYDTHTNKRTLKSIFVLAQNYKSYPSNDHYYNLNNNPPNLNEVPIYTLKEIFLLCQIALRWHENFRQQWPRWTTEPDRGKGGLCVKTGLTTRRCRQKRGIQGQKALSA